MPFNISYFYPQTLNAVVLQFKMEEDVEIVESFLK